jgi:hypothetical protein
VFQGAGGTLQVHDFNPGEENDLFWTVPISSDSVDGDAEDGAASLALTNFAIDDYGNVGNALSGGHEIAHASLTVQLNWSHLRRLVRASNANLPTPFRARELQADNSGATLRWSAFDSGTDFSGKAFSGRFSGRTNTADFAMLATERNGVFFSSREEDD